MQTCLTGTAKTVSVCIIKLWHNGSYDEKLIITPWATQSSLLPSHIT